MIHAAVATLFLLITASISADELANRLRLRTLADGCVVTQVPGCNSTTLGQLATGDCTLSDGTRADRLDVFLPIGREVGFTLRPLVPSYTSPALLVVPPAAEFQSPPFVVGGAGPTVWAQTFTASTWQIHVGTLDLTAGGKYALHVDCIGGSSTPRDCVYQDLLCGQSALGHLTAESCVFNNSVQAYGGWWIYGVQGDTLELVVYSDDFEPRFGIYDEESNFLQGSTSDSSSQASRRFRVPATGWYQVTVTTEDRGGGSYLIALECNNSGCLFPYLMSPIPSQSVPYGNVTTINLDLNVVGAFTASLVEDPFSPPAATSSTTVITTPPIDRTRTWVVHVENPCGSWDSERFSVTPQCAPMAFTTLPSSTKAQPGDIVTLSAAATGSGLSYAWYRGNPPDRSNPAGTGSVLTVVVERGVSYWIRVTDACGNSIDSPRVTLSAGSRRRAVRH